MTVGNVAVVELTEKGKAEKFTATADLLAFSEGSFGYFADPGKVTAPPA